jgi:beclin 1
LDQSYVVLPKGSERKDEHDGKLSHRLLVSGRLSSLASGISKTDHPLCQDCAYELQLKLEKNLMDLKNERATYQNFLSQIKELHEAESHDTTCENPTDAADEYVNSELEDKNIILQQRITEAKKELELLEIDELNYIQRLNDLEENENRYQEELAAVNLQYSQSLNHLEQLKKSNVIQDAFLISHEALLGTINGLRLGRLPKIQVC